MPAKLERCVSDLLNSKKFMPKADSKKRKSSAYAICTASIKNKADLKQIIFDLPPFLYADFNDDGELVFEEIEDFDFEKFDEESIDSSQERAYATGTQIYFSDEKNKEAKEKFTSFTHVDLKESSGSKKVKREGPDGEEKEYLNIPIEMLREGVFRHPWFGDLDINKKMMVNLIKNYANDILEREIALDVSHNPDHGAIGWLRDLKITRRDFGGKKGRRFVLVGSFDLNPIGEQLVRDEIFKYFSIEYNRNHTEREKTAEEIEKDKKKTQEERDRARWDGTDKGKEYGPTIFGGALTNRPFIPSMYAVKMSEGASTDVDAEPSSNASQPQQTTDGEGVAEAAEKAKGGESKDIKNKGKDDKKSGTCKTDKDDEVEAEEKRKCQDDEEEIKNAAATKKARPPESQLPNAAFALIKRDASGKIVIKRSLPHHGPGVKSPTENTSVDLGRLRNALARWNQVEGYSAEQKARAKRHLDAHARVLLPSHKPKASEGGVMFENRIAELKDQLDGMQDQKTELAQRIRDEITYLEKAQADYDAKLAEQKTQSEKFETQLTEQKQAADNTAAQLAELKRRDEERERKLAEITEKNRRNEIEMYCDTLGQNRYPPAIIKAVRSVLLGEKASVENGVVCQFTDKVDEKDVEYKFSLRNVVEYLVKSIPDTHKTDLNTGVQHNEHDDADPPASSDTKKVTLADGCEVDVMSDDFVKKSVKAAGHKTEVQ